MTEPVRTQTARYHFSPIVDRPNLHFPNGARVAVVVYVNIEHFPEDRSGPAIVPHTASLKPDPLNYGWRDYGQRVGIWRLMDILDRHGIRGTACLNSEVCREYPRIIEEGRRRRWEWMGHGRNNTEVLNGLSATDEGALIAHTLADIEGATGTRPTGWLSPFITGTENTADILAEAGVEYFCDYSCDDQPFPVRVRNRSLVAMPYSVECNDLPAALSFGLTGPAFGELIRDQFDVLHAEARSIPRVLPIALHTFIAGQPFRAKHIDAALSYIATHSDVWFATAGEINEWYRAAHMPGVG